MDNTRGRASRRIRQRQHSSLISDIYPATDCPKRRQTMAGFLLIAPTGTGKTTACKADPNFAGITIDGDSLIDWPRCGPNTDWTIKDREHLDIVLDHMRASNKCVCWYVGTTAVADSLDDGRLAPDEVAVVLISEGEHRRRVEYRRQSSHGWSTACEHRALCEKLTADYGVSRFTSLEEAIRHARSILKR